MSADTVRDQDFIVIQMHDSIRHMLKVTSDRDQKVARLRIPVKAIIGSSYGDVFEVNNRKRLIKLEGVDLLESLDIVPSEYTTTSSDAGNNSHYVDSNTAQKLSMDDVVHLKQSGTSGVDIIKSLIANSETWSSKTEFAQEKWLKRKQKKYITRLRIEKATPASICDVYSHKNRDKILGMRPDTLAQVLSQGSVVAGRKVLIVDGVIGLLVGSAAYRMRGHGMILGVYAGQQPHYELVDCLNLDEASTNIIQSLSSVELGPAASYVKEHGFLTIVPDTIISDTSTSTTASTSALITNTNLSEQSLQNEDNGNTMESMDEEENGDEDENEDDRLPVSEQQPLTTVSKNDHRSSHDNSNNDNSNNDDSINNNNKKRKYNASNRQPEYIDRIQKYLREGVESLIIASKYDPLPILTQSLVLLNPGCPFVIYHEFIEPLVQCYNYLQSQEIGIRLVLSDTWLREFQVLPGRSHPNMYMSATGGYLLSGTYVGTIGIDMNKQRNDE